MGDALEDNYLTEGQGASMGVEVESQPLSRKSSKFQASGDSYEDIEHSIKRARRMWWIATLLFVAMAGVFFVTTYLESSSAVVPYVRAFAEAAMIGALADWFAVVALFRRPLGLPIPHTGIIPRNKSRIGRSIGAFVQQNFLTPEVLEDEVVNISGAVARFLQSEQNRNEVISRIRVLMPRVVEVVNDDDVKAFFSKEIETTIENANVASVIAKILRGLTANQMHESILDETLIQLQAGFRGNQLWFRQQLREASPWFIPEFVDRKIYDAIVSKAEKTLSDALANKDHEFRKRMVQSLFSLIVRLETSDDLQRKVNDAKHLLLKSEVFREYVASLRNNLLEVVQSDVAGRESVIVQAFTRIVQDVMYTLSDSPELQQKCNRIVRGLLSSLVGNESRFVADLIARTVEGWDVRTLSDKLEEHVGADLQFIRINGTVVGGLAGLALYTLSSYLR